VERAAVNTVNYLLHRGGREALETQRISEKDNLTLEAIKAHYIKTGFSMSLAEAAEALGMSKGSVIADSFKRLEAAGLLVYSDNRKQCIPTDWRELLTSGIAKELQRLRDAASKADRIAQQNRERNAAYHARKRAKKQQKRT
jgi:DNA-binding transcriptional regulator GbsR (MarR family)